MKLNPKYKVSVILEKETGSDNNCTLNQWPLLETEHYDIAYALYELVGALNETKL